MPLESNLTHPPQVRPAPAGGSSCSVAPPVRHRRRLLLALCAAALTFAAGAQAQPVLMTHEGDGPLDQSVFPPSTNTTFYYDLQNPPGGTVSNVVFNVDGTNYDAGSNGSLGWDSTAVPNPSEHLVYVTLTDTEMTESGPQVLTLDSRNPAPPPTGPYSGPYGEGRPADVIVADLQLQSLQFAGGGVLTLGNSADPASGSTPALVPVPQITWAQASPPPYAATNPAGYVMGSTPSLALTLYPLTGSVTMGVTLNVTATSNVPDPAHPGQDLGVTLKNTGATTPVPLAGTPLTGPTTTVPADNALLGEVALYNVSFTDLTLWVQFTHTGLTPDPWKSVNSYTANGPFVNTLYATLGQPTAPMAQPWVGVLFDACQWAEGTTTATAATTDLVNGEYINGLYNGGRPAFTGAFTDGAETFHLQRFLANSTPHVLYGQCNDFSDFLVCLSNSLGARPLSTQRSVTVAEDNAGSHFYTQPITAAGDMNPTDAAPFPGGWAYHQWANDTTIFDGCLRFGGTTAPADVQGPNFGSSYNTSLVASYLHPFTPPDPPVTDWDPQTSFTPTIAN